MTVKQLIEKLQTFDENLTVLCDRWSDYQPVIPEEITLVKATHRGPLHSWERAGIYYLRVEENQIETMAPELRANIKYYVHFEGN